MSIPKLIKKNTNNTTEYNKLLYQVSFDEKKGLKENTIVNYIKKKQFGWNHKIYKNIKKELNEQYDFMTKPFEIEEGVLKCGKCNSQKTFSFSKQIRSADEGTTVFAQCAECGNRWTM